MSASRPVITGSCSAQAGLSTGTPVEPGLGLAGHLGMVYVRTALDRGWFFDVADRGPAPPIRVAASRLRLAGAVLRLWASEQSGADQVIVDLDQPECLVLVERREDGECFLHVSAATLDVARRGAAAAREALGVGTPTSHAPEEVSVVCRSAYGGATVRRVHMELSSFADIECNYPPATRRELAGVMQGVCPSAGRLVVWSGAPGTGKTFALRALLRAWSSWCDVYVLLDGASLLEEGDPEYLVELAAPELAMTLHQRARPRLLVLEDVGSLVALDAASRQAGALSRVLGLLDGVLAQAVATYMLITTDEPLRALHPALLRAGRLHASTKFRRFTRDEASTWMTERRAGGSPQSPATLAELYAAVDATAPTREPAGFGFGA